MNALAVIPARSGSKGVKNKNIRELSGKPLLSYSIKAAMDSGCFHEIMVSTDSAEYADIARKFGAQVPFLRQKVTASDYASSWDVILEVINNYKKIGKNFSHVCLLQPTSPLRNSDDIRNAFAQLERKKAEAVVSVCEVEHSPLLCGMLDESENMEQFIPEDSNRRRQDMGKYYRLNGAIYLTDIRFLEESTYLFRRGCYAYVMRKNHSIDIDTEEDFIIAESILANQKSD